MTLSDPPDREEFLDEELSLAGLRRERGAMMRRAEGSAKKGVRWMPWRLRPKKDATTRRNALGRRW